MKLAGCIYAAIAKAEGAKIDHGKTALQKIIYFILLDEQKSELYIPFHYGPYSKQVQIVCENLIINKYIDYDEKQKNFLLKKKIEEKKLLIEEHLLIRLDTVITFLSQNGITSTPKLAMLSKVLFFLKNRPNQQTNIHNFIRDKSKLYGWFELAKSPEATLDSFIRLANSLSDRLAVMSYA